MGRDHISALAIRSAMSRKAGIILLIAGALLMAAGLVRGEFYDTLSKGAYLCLECIGIG